MAHHLKLKNIRMVSLSIPYVVKGIVIAVLVAYSLSFGDLGILKASDELLIKQAFFTSKNTLVIRTDSTIEFCKLPEFGEEPQTPIVHENTNIIKVGNSEGKISIFSNLYFHNPQNIFTITKTTTTQKDIENSTIQYSLSKYSQQQGNNSKFPEKNFEISLSKFNIPDPNEVDTSMIISQQDILHGTMTFITRTEVIKVIITDKKDSKIGQEICNFSEINIVENEFRVCQPFAIRKSHNPNLPAIAVSFSNCVNTVVLNSQNLTPIFKKNPFKIFGKTEFDFAGVYSSFIVGVEGNSDLDDGITYLNVLKISNIGPQGPSGGSIFKKSLSLLKNKIVIEEKFQKMVVKGIPNSSFAIFSGIGGSMNTALRMINVDLFEVQNKMKNINMEQIVNNFGNLEYPLIYINSDALADKLIFLASPRLEEPISGLSDKNVYVAQTSESIKNSKFFKNFECKIDNFDNFRICRACSYINYDAYECLVCGSGLQLNYPTNVCQGCFKAFHSNLDCQCPKNCDLCIQDETQNTDSQVTSNCIQCKFHFKKNSEGDCIKLLDKPEPNVKKNLDKKKTAIELNDDENNQNWNNSDGGKPSQINDKYDDNNDSGDSLDGIILPIVLIVLTFLCCFISIILGCLVRERRKNNQIREKLKRKKKNKNKKEKVKGRDRKSKLLSVISEEDTVIDSVFTSRNVTQNLL